MNLFTNACPECGSEDVYADHQYKTKSYLPKPYGIQGHQSIVNAPSYTQITGVLMLRYYPVNDIAVLIKTGVALARTC